MPGPIPKNSNRRLSKDKSRNDSIEQVKSKNVNNSYYKELTDVNAKWHKTMRRWFESLKHSGQSSFYQPSDWATARMWCDLMTKELNSPKGVSASLVSQFTIVANSLLTTEGARRRANIEMIPATEEQAIKNAVDNELEEQMKEFS